tara:strand:+ start:61 stop:393 length:333 start_codon:yes stop_codon:yes gene_type:complete
MDEIRKKYDDGKLSLGMWDCSFYFVDGDGNQLLDKNGKVRLFTADDHDFSYMADGVEFDELSEAERNPVDEITSLLSDLKDWYGRADQDHLGQGADIIEDIITFFEKGEQ